MDEKFIELYAKFIGLTPNAVKELLVDQENASTKTSRAKTCLAFYEIQAQEIKKLKESCQNIYWHAEQIKRQQDVSAGKSTSASILAKRIMKETSKYIN